GLVPHGGGAGGEVLSGGRQSGHGEGQAGQQDFHAHHVRPIRLISQSSWTPNLAFTSARTASPRPSRSAAVASPVLIRKLECSGENMAPPPFPETLNGLPRQPASSTSFQDERPGGFLNVEPPVFSRMGWVGSRRAAISA